MYYQHYVWPQDICTVIHNNTVHYCTYHMSNHKPFSMNKDQSS